MRRLTSADLRELLRRLGELWVSYLKGHLVLALLIGAITWVINAGIGLSWALPLGLIAGMLETIPTFGPLIAAIPAVIVALWNGSSVIPVPNWAFALIVAGIYLLIQQVGSLVLEPRVLGKRLNLPPIVVLISVIIGAALASVVGAYLAVPVVASVREIVRFLRQPAPPSEA
ncbi:MAG: AI-2E family transporter [Chloroflexota bacterium]